MKAWNINFMAKRQMAMLFSIVLVLISILSLATQRLNLGVDFTGGTLVEVGYDQPVDLAGIRSLLNTSSFDNATIQYFGSATEVMVRIPPQENIEQAKIGDEILELLAADGDVVDMRRVEFVGPKVGEELSNDGGLAMIYALFGILIYITLRFKMSFGFGAIVALIHDVVITLGVISLTQLTFDLTVLAPILAVIGYSLNDSIVVFDRIRENFRLLREQDSKAIFNTSLNQTLSRTLMTSLTTLIALVALFLLGGKTIHAFSAALIVGLIIGTYSSIYVASTVTLALGISKQDLMPVEREGADFDSKS